MIVQCAECKTSFRLNDELVPPRSIKVRCARCGHVFAMDGREVDTKASMELATPVAAASAPSPSKFGDLQLEASSVAPSRTEAPLPERDSPLAQSVERGGSSVAQAAPPAASSSPSTPKAEVVSPPAPKAEVVSPPAPKAEVVSSPAPVAKASPQVTLPVTPQAASLADARPEAASVSSPTSLAAAPSPASPAVGRPGELQLERSEPLMGASPAAIVDGITAVAVEAPPAPVPESFRQLDLDASAKVAEPAAVEVAPQQKRQDDKARRLARALVSDILVYNREKRDKALQGGNLVQALAGEIKKSWEVYKERVTPEVANSTNHFREALNDILADGQQIF